MFLQMLDFWITHNVETYYKMRYGASWRWYYLNWEQNGEFIP